MLHFAPPFHLMSDSVIPSWRPALDAITGARHGGQSASLLAQLEALDRQHPHVAEIAYQLAWTHESVGHDAPARTHYERAVALGLPPNEQSGAIIGLATCLRNLGELEAAALTLESGRTQFPDQPEFSAYLSLVRHAQGRHIEALQLALTTLIEHSEDPGITAHQRNLRHFINQLG